MDKSSKWIQNIVNAFVWEGSGSFEVISETLDILVISVTAYSDVEHDGDIEGIKSQVYNLRGKTFTEDGITYEVIDTDCNVKTIGGNADDDFEVKATGSVRFRKS